MLEPQIRPAPKGLFSRIEYSLRSDATVSGSAEAIQWISEPGTIDAFSCGFFETSEPSSVSDPFSPTGPGSTYLFFTSQPTTGVAVRDDLAMVEFAAAGGDEREFHLAVSQIDWLRRSGEDYARVIRLALSIGAHALARQLVREGSRMFPDNPEVERIAAILAPNEPARPAGGADPSVLANRHWFIENQAAYRGQWVAVKDGQLLGAARTLAELKEQVPDWRQATLTKIVD